MLKRLFARFAAAGAALAFCAAALAAPLPSMNAASSPINPAIINDFNLFLNQLNGGLGYSGVSQIVSFGQTCSASGATPQTCNGQRGSVTTNSLATAAQAAANFVINDSFVTAANVCNVSVASYSGTFGTNGVPVIEGSTTGAGTITVSIGNAGAANALAGTIGLAFWCQ